MSFPEGKETGPMVRAEDLYAQMYNIALGDAPRPVTPDAHEMANDAVNVRVHIANQLLHGGPTPYAGEMNDTLATSYLMLLTFGPQPE